MELRQIQYFIEVADREHVTEAAHAMHVAQSAVSRQIYNLEAELGVKLFIREGRNVRLTPTGRVFLKHMKEAMLVIENAKREIAEQIDPERGTIRIGFPSSMANLTLPSAISAFRKEYPNVKFNFKQGAYRKLIESVIRGDIDMALLGPLPTNVNKIQGEVLFYEDLVALLPVSHPLANEKYLKLDQLKNDSFVLFPNGFVLREIVVKACKEQNFEPTVSFEGVDIDAIKGLVSAGLGVTIIPEMTLIENLPRSTVQVPIIEPKVSRTVGVIISNERELLPTEKIFYDFLKKFFKENNLLQL